MARQKSIREAGEGSSRPAKKSRVQQQRPRPSSQPVVVEDSTESLPDFPQVQFETKELRASFLTLLQNKIVATRFLHKPTLEKLGCFDELTRMLRKSGLTGLVEMDELTYRTLTLEFFSSFAFNEDAYKANSQCACITFRVLNSTHVLTMETFGGYLGVSFTGPILASNDSWKVMWSLVSDEGIVGKVRYHGTSVHLPPIRYFLRLMGNTVAYNTSQAEITILMGFFQLEITTRPTLNIAYLVALHFKRIAVNNIKTICTGGIVTKLTRALFPTAPIEEVAVTPTSRYMDWEYCTSVYWADKEGWWKVSGERFCKIPVPLPPIRARVHSKYGSTPPMPSLKLVRDVTAPREAPTTGQPAGQPTGAAPRAPHDLPTSTSTSTSDEPAYPANFRPYPSIPRPVTYDLQGIGEFLDNMCRSIEVHQQDMALASFRHYEASVRRGRVPAVQVHPSFYAYPEGGYPEEESSDDEDADAASSGGSDGEEEDAAEVAAEVADPKGKEKVADDGSDSEYDPTDE